MKNIFSIELQGLISEGLRLSLNNEGTSYVPSILSSIISEYARNEKVQDDTFSVYEDLNIPEAGEVFKKSHWEGVKTVYSYMKVLGTMFDTLEENASLLYAKFESEKNELDTIEKRIRNKVAALRLYNSSYSFGKEFLGSRPEDFIHRPVSQDRPLLEVIPQSTGLTLGVINRSSLRYLVSFFGNGRPGDVYNSRRIRRDLVEAVSQSGNWFEYSSVSPIELTLVIKPEKLDIVNAVGIRVRRQEDEDIIISSVACVENGIKRELETNLAIEESLYIPIVPVFATEIHVKILSNYRSTVGNERNGIVYPVERYLLAIESIEIFKNEYRSKGSIETKRVEDSNLSGSLLSLSSIERVSDNKKLSSVKVQAKDQSNYKVIGLVEESENDFINVNNGFSLLVSVDRNDQAFLEEESIGEEGRVWEIVEGKLILVNNNQRFLFTKDEVLWEKKWDLREAYKVNSRAYETEIAGNYKTMLPTFLSIYSEKNLKESLEVYREQVRLEISFLVSDTSCLLVKENGVWCIYWQGQISNILEIRMKEKGVLSNGEIFFSSAAIPDMSKVKALRASYNNTPKRIEERVTYLGNNISSLNFFKEVDSLLVSESLTEVVLVPLDPLGTLADNQYSVDSINGILYLGFDPSDLYVTWKSLEEVGVSGKWDIRKDRNGNKRWVIKSDSYTENERKEGSLSVRESSLLRTGTKLYKNIGRVWDGNKTIYLSESNVTRGSFKVQGADYTEVPYIDGRTEFLKDQMELSAAIIARRPGTDLLEITYTSFTLLLRDMGLISRNPYMRSAITVTPTTEGEYQILWDEGKVLLFSRLDLNAEDLNVSGFLENEVTKDLVSVDYENGKAHTNNPAVFSNKTFTYRFSEIVFHGNLGEQKNYRKRDGELIADIDNCAVAYISDSRQVERFKDYYSPIIKSINVRLA